MCVFFSKTKTTIKSMAYQKSVRVIDLKSKKQQHTLTTLRNIGTCCNVFLYIDCKNGCLIFTFTFHKLKTNKNHISQGRNSKAYKMYIYFDKTVLGN